MALLNQRQAYLKDYVNSIQAQLHQIPEPAFQEYQTSKFIAEELRKLGCVVKEYVGQTGVVAEIKGSKSGPCLAVRADMDCIVHNHGPETFYRHSCGHDAHSSIALGVAKQFSKQSEALCGTLKLIFQPAEETGQGAKAMVQAGVLDNVDYLLGFHLRPVQECEIGKVSPALFHQAASFIQGEIVGTPAHGGRPHLGVNAIEVIAAMVNNVSAIHSDPLCSSSIKFTHVSTGKGSMNVIPGHASFSLDVRSDNNQQLGALIREAKQRLIKTAEMYGAELKLDVIEGVPAPEYDKEFQRLIEQGIIDALGENGLAKPIKTPGGEDFHYYSLLSNVKTGYLGLGAGVMPGLHHPEMTFEKDIMVTGVLVVTQIVERLLKSDQIL